jgi:hypothetical protein
MVSGMTGIPDRRATPAVRPAGGGEDDMGRVEGLRVVLDLDRQARGQATT